jgi:hypothetical protein
MPALAPDLAGRKRCERWPSGADVRTARPEGRKDPGGTVTVADGQTRVVYRLGNYP